MTEPVLAIIPARAGSKGVPGKNRRRVSGMPLWRWSYNAARFGTMVSEILLTTDDEKIIEDAEDVISPAIHIVRRPPELATDRAPLDAALLHAIDAIGYDGIVVVLQPTVPVRRPGLVDECIRVFRAFPSAKSLITVNPLHFVWDGQSGALVNPPRVNRQQMTRQLYHEDGSVVVCRAKDLRDSGSRIMEPTILFETERTVDIDTEEDLALAEFLLTRRSEKAS